MNRDRMIKIGIVVLGIAGLALLMAGGCRPKVVRDASTFHAEIESARARQLEAAEALFAAAEDARARGAIEDCRRYARPALLIEAFASTQADRALYLGGLLEEDPGPSSVLRSVSEVCGP